MVKIRIKVKIGSVDIAKIRIRVPSYRLKRYFGENLGAPFIIVFQILLVACAGLLVQGNSAMANEVAVYAYYSLVVGVVLQLVCFIKHGKRLLSEYLISILRGAFSKLLTVLRLDLRGVLLLGTVVRLVLMPFTAHPFDVYAWYTYCVGVLEHGLDANGILGSLRPLWLLTLTPIAYSYGFLSSITGFRAVSVGELPYRLNPHYGVEFVTDPLFNVLVKAPMLMADIATTVVLYKMVMQFLGREKARKASLLFYLNPICIWISAAWGQYESIPAFFTVLSLYLLLNEKMDSSALSLLAATLFKVYSAVFLIPMSVYLLKRANRESLLKCYVAFFTPMLVFLIMGGTQVVNDFVRFILGFFSTGTFFGVFGFGLTYWSISMLYPLDPSVWAPFSNFLMVILLSISLYFVLRDGFDAPLNGLVVGTFLMVAAVFLSYRIVGETRFLWLLPFLTLMLAVKVVSERLYGFLSLTAFVYAQKNFPYYLLPMATMSQDMLKPLFEFAYPFGKVVDGALLPTPLSAAVLAVLGTVFSILMLTTYVRSIRKV